MEAPAEPTQTVPNDAKVNAGCEEFDGQAIGPDGFNRQFFRTIAVPVERYLFAAAGTYEVTDDINLFFEGTYSSKTKSSRIIEPFFLSSGRYLPVNNGGRVPISRPIVDWNNVRKPARSSATSSMLRQD